MTLDASKLEQALNAVGERLAADKPMGRVRLSLVGGSAGLLSGWLAGSRATADVHVTTTEPAEAWDAVAKAAASVAADFGLQAHWLNNDGRIFVRCLLGRSSTHCEVHRDGHSL